MPRITIVVLIAGLHGYCRGHQVGDVWSAADEFNNLVDDTQNAGGESESSQFDSLWAEVFNDAPAEFRESADGPSDNPVDGPIDVPADSTYAGHTYLRSGSSMAAGHQSRKASLANVASTESMTDADTSNDLDFDIPIETRADFPKQHALVAPNLGEMGGKMAVLKEERAAREGAEEQLGTASTEVLRRMNDAIPMQQSLARKRADLNAETQKLEELQAEDAQVQSRRDALYEKLRAVMEPRLLNLRARLSRQQKVAKKAQHHLESWRQELNKYKGQAVSELEAKHRSEVYMQRSEEEAARAEKAAAAASKAYEEEKTKAVQEVEAYKVVLAHYKATIEQEHVQENLAGGDAASLDRMNKIYDMEKVRVDQSFAIEKDRLAAKIAKARALRDETERQIQEEQRRYQEWRTQEKDRIREVAKRRAEYDTAQKAFAAQREDVFKRAAAQSGDQAVSNSEWQWDDWAFDGAAPGEAPSEDSGEGAVHLDSN